MVMKRRTERGGERARERERPITTAGTAATTATTASRHELICRPALEITEERRAPGYRIQYCLLLNQNVNQLFPGGTVPNTVQDISL